MSMEQALTFIITPATGPVRQLETLRDAGRAITQDLPAGFLKKPHWLRAGQAVVTADETGEASAVQAATEALVHALEAEGWLAPPIEEFRLRRLRTYLQELEEQLAEPVRRSTEGSVGNGMSDAVDHR